MTKQKYFNIYIHLILTISQGDASEEKGITTIPSRLSPPWVWVLRDSECSVYLWIPQDLTQCLAKQGPQLSVEWVICMNYLFFESHWIPLYLKEATAILEATPKPPRATKSEASPLLHGTSPKPCSLPPLKTSAQKSSEDRCVEIMMCVGLGTDPVLTFIFTNDNAQEALFSPSGWSNGELMFSLLFPY